MSEAIEDREPPADEHGPERVPPHDLLAEQSAIGGMLLSAAAILDVVEVVRPIDFYIPKHEVIFEAILAMRAEGNPIDVITVGEHLMAEGLIGRAGGAEYLHTLTGVVPTAANAGYYATLVARKAVLRRLVEAGTRIVQMGYASEGDLLDLVAKAQTEVDQVGAPRRRKVRAIGETLLDLIGTLESKPSYIRTPWEKSLDKIIGGFAPGGLYVFAARPGSGKTISVLQCATRLAHVGSVAFSSLEMTEEELQLRLISQYGPVHMSALRNHELTDIDWKLAAEARARLVDAPIYIDDSPDASVAQIRAHALAVGRKQPLAGIAVDYLQLVKGEGRDRREIVDAVAMQLKQLAKDLNVPVVAAAQLKRAAAPRGRNRVLPTLEDLREAGGIEQAADVVMLLDRDKERTPHEITVVVAKNRHGDQGQFRLAWQAQYARLRDLEWSPAALIEKEELT